jgi:sterol desaturase/sphingolipid hydroxylase (fatty acid hydroxylase superfamily)
MDVLLETRPVRFLQSLTMDDVGTEALWAFKTWLHYYLSVHVLYYVLSYALRVWRTWHRPTADTLKMSKKRIWEHIEMSEIAFPVYCLVPVLGDWGRKHQISRICYSVEECGGWPAIVLNCCVYMFLVEAGVFWVHYWLLHVFPWGKRVFNHAKHHSFKLESEMTSFSGYAFEAIDGASQGLPFILFQYLIPIPFAFALVMGATVGAWTLLIHMGDMHLPWPLMGPDYHNIHHIYNWYNFGLFTQFFDGLFGQLR